jgi:hypothetical protein
MGDDCCLDRIWNEKNVKVIVSIIFCVVFLPMKRRFVEERLIFIKTYIF